MPGMQRGQKQSSRVLTDRIDENNEELRRLFEALKVQINTIAGNSGLVMDLAGACRRNKRVQQCRAEIEYLKDVRNIISHPWRNSVGPAVVVTSDLINRTRQLIENIASIRTASKVGVAVGTLYTATTNTKLVAVTTIMREKRYSHVPVLDERGRVIGVFNEAAVFDYLMSQTIIELNDTIVIGDIMDHCHLDAGHTEEFRFIGPSTTEDEMLDHLINVQGPYTRVGALFVTPSGKKTEPLNRMITIWDVMQSGA